MMGAECERGTGWVYCAHAESPLAICRCDCTCTDQRHCPSGKGPTTPEQRLADTKRQFMAVIERRDV